MPCRYVEEMTQLPCWPTTGQQGRCHTRGESQGMCNITHTPPLSSNKADPHSGFASHRKCHQKSKIGVSVARQKGFMSSKNFLKKKKKKLLKFLVTVATLLMGDNALNCHFGVFSTNFCLQCSCLWTQVQHYCMKNHVKGN